MGSAKRLGGLSNSPHPRASNSIVNLLTTFSWPSSSVGMQMGIAQTKPKLKNAEGIRRQLPVSTQHLGGCQNYGPFLGTLNIKCRIYQRSKKDHDFDNHPSSELRGSGLGCRV